MPDGFVGKASQNYLEKVAAALIIAGEIHSHDPFSGISYKIVPPPGLPARINVEPPYDPASAMSGGYSTGVGNQTNIAVDRSIYTDALNKIRTTDEKAAEELYKVITQIEDLCETSYVLPKTLPKYLSILDYVKISLAEFRSLTDDAGTKTDSFVEEIINTG
ncbi:MAG: hypothetical protein FWG61_08570 [Firmicutes bacterium]|nr:hypothetical protein [Bacillota bacterium]